MYGNGTEKWQTVLSVVDVKTLFSHQHRTKRWSTSRVRHWLSPSNQISAPTITQVCHSQSHRISSFFLIFLISQKRIIIIIMIRRLTREDKSLKRLTLISSAFTDTWNFRWHIPFSINSFLMSMIFVYVYTYTYIYFSCMGMCGLKGGKILISLHMQSRS